MKRQELEISRRRRCLCGQKIFSLEENESNTHRDICRLFGWCRLRLRCQMTDKNATEISFLNSLRRDTDDLGCVRFDRCKRIPH
ncbi:hypothetical protein VTN77DRAFT_633 [Rasamsonia byssochlamydoides]|uniref:uncharacterized protein n=1 Tax=Rasamsonia byssochlamydoides TaxID=89139 RepID=UPI003744B1A0